MSSEQTYPPVTPYLLYEDVAAALDWLSAAFGFQERLRFAADDGTINHAEMITGPGGLIMLGDPGPDYRNPSNRGGATVLIHVEVADVDAHYQRAVAAGAVILREPADEDYGDRRYDAQDPEGHSWSFAQHLRDVAPTEWGATTNDG
jgi:uncharacterized glyoxalase superfamily protein PhnB